MENNHVNEYPSRRTAFKSVLVGGVAVAVGGPMAAADTATADKEILTDKQCIMEAGLTEAEADCWAKTAEAAGAFFELPKLHEEDAKEVAVAIHVVQQKLLARPTYRKYLEIAKANHERKKQR